MRARRRRYTGQAAPPETPPVSALRCCRAGRAHGYPTGFRTTSRPPLRGQQRRRGSGCGCDHATCRAAAAAAARARDQLPSPPQVTQRTQPPPRALLLQKQQQAAQQGHRRARWAGQPAPRRARRWSAGSALGALPPPHPRGCRCCHHGRRCCHHLHCHRRRTPSCPRAHHRCRRYCRQRRRGRRRRLRAARVAPRGDARQPPLASLPPSRRQTPPAPHRAEEGAGSARSGHPRRLPRQQRRQTPRGAAAGRRTRTRWRGRRRSRHHPAPHRGCAVGGVRGGPRRGQP